MRDMDVWDMISESVNKKIVFHHLFLEIVEEDFDLDELNNFLPLDELTLNIFYQMPNLYKNYIILAKEKYKFQTMNKKQLMLKFVEEMRESNGDTNKNYFIGLKFKEELFRRFIMDRLPDDKAKEIAPLTFKGGNKK